MSDKGINLNAAKETLVKIENYDNSLNKSFNTFNLLLSNANANYSSNNKSLLVERERSVLKNFTKLSNLSKKHAEVIKRNIMKYTNTQKTVSNILNK